ERLEALAVVQNLSFWNVVVNEMDNSDVGQPHCRRSPGIRRLHYGSISEYDSYRSCHLFNGRHLSPPHAVREEAGKLWTDSSDLAFDTLCGRNGTGRSFQVKPLVA